MSGNRYVLHDAHGNTYIETITELVESDKLDSALWEINSKNTNGIRITNLILNEQYEIIEVNSKGEVINENNSNYNVSYSSSNVTITNTTEVPGIIITNTIKTKSLDIIKKWNDSQNTSHRPDSIVVTLYANSSIATDINGNRLENIEIKNTNSIDNYTWKYTFNDLPILDKNGNENEENLRPESIMFIIVRTDTNEEVRRVIVNKDTDWKYSCNDLLKYNEIGFEIEYKVYEVVLDSIYYTNKNIITLNNEVENKAQIVEARDYDNKSAKDIDSTSNVWIDGEDDQDTEKVRVKYFDLSLSKYATKTIVIRNGKEEVVHTGNGQGKEKIAKVDIKTSEIEDVVVKLEYLIKVTIKLTWINGENNMGLKTNIAEISKDSNEYNTPDIASTPNNMNLDEDDTDDSQL